MTLQNLVLIWLMFHEKRVWVQVFFGYFYDCAGACLRLNIRIRGVKS